MKINGEEDVPLLDAQVIPRFLHTLSCAHYPSVLLDALPS